MTNTSKQLLEQQVDEEIALRLKANDDLRDSTKKWHATKLKLEVYVIISNIIL